MTIASLEDLTEAQLASLPPDVLRYHLWQQRWLDTARPNQIPPDGDWTECGYMAGRGFGKALALDTPIPTPTGWSTMGALRDGDEVFDEAGRVCRVVQAHVVQIGRPCYRVSFSDGESIVADEDHLWATETLLARKYAARRKTAAPLSVVTTARIRDTLMHGKDRNHAVPVAGPLQLPSLDLPIDPYVMGIWLGDGSSAGAEITTADQQVLDELVASGEALGRSVAAGGSAQTVRVGGAPLQRDALGRMTANGSLHSRLRALGLLHDKHVPPAYLRASAEQRLALLQGLMDSDGTCSATGHVEFCSTLRVLAENVLELVASLGMKATLASGRATLRGADCGPKYRVCWTPYVPVFRLQRKRDRQRAPGAQAARQARRYITAVEPVPSVPVRCITVDSPSALYLAGRSMVPTHNTRVGAEWLAAQAIEDDQALDRAVIAPTYGDVKFTCFQGPAGLMKVIPPELVINYNSTDLIIQVRTLSGKVATIRGFTAEKPERLRGPQHADIWCDELAAWQYPQETWDMALMGLRLGPRPRILWTTTPKPIELVRKLTEPKPSRVLVRGSTYDNRANLPDSFFDQLAQFEGTTIGRQELEGELIDPEESGVIRRSWLRLWPAAKPLPVFDWIVMSLDTAFTEATTDKKSHDPDYSACTVWGGFRHKVKMPDGGVDERAHVLLLDCWQEQLGLPDLVKRVKRELNVAYGDDQDTALIKPLIGASKPMTSGRKPDIVVIEDKGSGISLRQVLDREGVASYAYNPGRADKLTRLHIVSPIFARRQVWLPESDKFPGRARTWTDPLVHQLCSFTGSGSLKHDDFVDSTTQALRLMMDKNMLSAVQPQPTVREPTPPRTVVNPYAA